MHLFQYRPGAGRPALIDFRSLECFYWVAQLNSFSRTAERLHISQPAISQRVAALEAALGGALLERVGRSFLLTPRGQVLVEYCERFLDLRAEMLAAVTAPHAVRGTVRLGVSETIVRLWLNQFLERVQAHYPDLVIDLTVDVSPVMLDQLLRGDLDLCLCLGLSGDERIVNRPLFKTPLAFLASPQFDLGPEPLGIEALRQVPIITLPKGTTPYMILLRALGRAGDKPPRIYSNSSLSSVLQMAVDGIGICVVPRAVASRELAEGRLHVLQTALDLPDHSFNACHLHRVGGGVIEHLALLAQGVGSSLAGEPSGSGGRKGRDQTSQSDAAT